MKEQMINILHFLGLAYWVEILTEKPRCTYYFGPYFHKSEAQAASLGFIEDLEQEGAQGIKVLIKRCKPVNLTVYEDEVGELIKPQPIFSSQT